MLTAPEQCGRHLDRAALVAQRLDRQARGDAAIERQVQRRCFIGGFLHAREVGREIAPDDIRREGGRLGLRRARLGTLGGRLSGRRMTSSARARWARRRRKPRSSSAGDQAMDADFDFSFRAPFISSKEGEAGRA